MPRQACVPNGGICLLKHTSMFESAAYGDLQLVQTNKFSGHCSGWRKQEKSSRIR